MARVIVILALMLAITAAMFAITRKSAIAPGEAANEPSATVRLTETSDVATEQDTESLKSADPRTFATGAGSANTSPEEAATATTQDVTNGPVAGAAPTFGTAGIDRKGRASFTGTATPGEAISLISDGKAIGSTKADSTGNWTLGFKPPKSNRQQELLVSAQGHDGTTIIGPQRAIIRPPESKGGLPRITLKAVGPSAAVPEAKTGLVVEHVSSGDNGFTKLRGRADPGATVKVAINGKPGGETRVASDGTWSLAASNASGANADRLRLQLVDTDGATLDEANVPYNVPAASPQLAAAEAKVKSDFPSVLTSKPKPRSKPQKAVEASQAIAALVEPKAATDAGQAEKSTVVKVRRGDSLWRIARRHLGKGKKWAAFYNANKEKIDNPDLIYPGQVLIIPG